MFGSFLSSSCLLWGIMSYLHYFSLFAYSRVQHILYCKVFLFSFSSPENLYYLIWLIDCWCFNDTFSNISALPWRPVLVMEEAGVPGENNRPWTSNWYTLSPPDASRVHPFYNLQSRAQSHAVVMMVLYEMLGNPTT